MTFYAFFSEIPGFDPSDSAVIEEAHSDAFSRANTKSSSNGSFGIVDGLPDLDTFYTHFFMDRNVADTSTQTAVEWRDNTDTAVIRMRITTGGTSNILMQRNVTGTWTDCGSAISAHIVEDTEIDVYIDAQASGTIKVYLAGTLRLTYTGDLSAMDNIAAVYFYGSANESSNASYWGGCISSEPTIGGRLATYYPNGAGASSQWTNGFANIDETVHNDADFIYTDTADDLSLFAITGPSLTGYTVQAVGVYARAKNDGAGPTGIQLALRSGSTTGLSSTSALDVGYETHGNIWTTNPDTSADFAVSEIASLQIGVKAIA